MPPAFDIPGDLALTEDGTDFVFSDTSEALVQSIANGLMIFPGTWKFNLKAGFPLLTLGFVTTWRLPFLKGELTRYFLSFPDVLDVVKLDVEPVSSDTQVIAAISFDLKLRDGSRITNRDVFLPLLQSL